MYLYRTKYVRSTGTGPVRGPREAPGPPLPWVQYIPRNVVHMFCELNINCIRNCRVLTMQSREPWADLVLHLCQVVMSHPGFPCFMRDLVRFPYRVHLGEYPDKSMSMHFTCKHTRRPCTQDTTSPHSMYWTQSGMQLQNTTTHMIRLQSGMHDQPNG